MLWCVEVASCCCVQEFQELSWWKERSSTLQRKDGDRAGESCQEAMASVAFHWWLHCTCGLVRPHQELCCYTQELLSTKEAARAEQDAMTKPMMGLTERLQAAEASGKAAADRLLHETEVRASLDTQLAASSAQQLQVAQQMVQLREQLHAQEAISTQQQEEHSAQLYSEITGLQVQLRAQEAALAEAAKECSTTESAHKGAQVQLADQERQIERLKLCITQLHNQLKAQGATLAKQQTEEAVLQQSSILQLQAQLKQKEADLDRQLREQTLRETAHTAALEQAQAEVEKLKAQLAGIEAGKAHDVEAKIDDYACHSEMLEQLQQEHAQEINRQVLSPCITHSSSSVFASVPITHALDQTRAQTLLSLLQRALST